MEDFKPGETHAALADSQLKSLGPKTDFSRRGFAKTALGVGFALAAQPVAAQSVITTDAKEAWQNMLAWFRGHGV